ncbi:MAG: DUF4922 domain-containing protein [Prevotella sp.]|nr:DUF4922 domain-containing protein [Prevotella sp.]MCM1075303.1 DUF4922 domain-containing protein [Ruminococcus sp.]
MNRTPELKDFFNRQLSLWPEVKARFDALKHVQIREVTLDDFPLRLQYNPARAVSTAAKVDKDSISARPCFLCQANRPVQQIIYPGFKEYDTLVNPFPIFPMHFTITSQKHQHQDNVDVYEMTDIALQLPGMVVFYNGSTAGASAPDHLHFQAGNKDLLSICKTLEQTPGVLLKATSEFKAYDVDFFPAEVIHFVSRELADEMIIWFDTLLPTDGKTLTLQKGMRNLLMWIDETGLLHTLFMPRTKHRPECYFKEDGYMVSPGAVDMAGVIITPRLDDFHKIKKSDLRRIYAEVSLPYKELPTFQKLMLL